MTEYLTKKSINAIRKRILFTDRMATLVTEAEKAYRFGAQTAVSIDTIKELRGLFATAARLRDREREALSAADHVTLSQGNALYRRLSAYRYLAARKGNGIEPIDMEYIFRRALLDQIQDDDAWLASSDTAIKDDVAVLRAAGQVILRGLVCDGLAALREDETGTYLVRTPAGAAIHHETLAEKWGDNALLCEYVLRGISASEVENATVLPA